MRSAAWMSVASIAMLAACGRSAGEPAGPDGGVGVTDAGPIEDAGTDAGSADGGVPDGGVAQALEVWQYELISTGQSDNFTSQVALIGPPRFKLDEELFDHRVVGDVALHPRGLPPEAFGEVFSTANGATFHAQSVAPSGDPFQKGQPIGLVTDLIVARRLRKTADQAKLRVAITGISLDMIDTDPFRPTGPRCPWDDPKVGEDNCGQSMVSELRLTIDAWKTAPNGDPIPVHHLGAHARLNGWHGHWNFTAGTDGDSDSFVWDEARLEFIPDFADDPDRFARAIARLPPSSDPLETPPPIRVSVPLDRVDVGQDVDLHVHVTLRAFNRKQLESFAGAFFWDPESLQGLQLETEGVILEQAASPLEQRVPPPPDASVPTCAGGPDPAAGTLQFGAATVRTFEGSGSVALVPVIRSGGARGKVSALFLTGDGTAHAGVDYQATTTLVRFADGEEGTRLLPVTILDNTTLDGARTAQLSLSQPGGCASLGAQTTTLLEIIDDDSRSAAPRFQLGGALSGLVGSGLVLRDLFSGATVAPAADGPFAFPPQPAGVSYDVRIDTQPDGPAQACSVAHGTGTLTADVTDLAVTCAPPLPQGGLDPSFGVGGRAVSTIPGAPVAMARQADGKWLLVGGLTLARFNVDGSVDGSFGTTGVVTIAWNGGPFDAAQAVAVQPDGKIVVAGFTNVNNQDDFALARFTIEGALDASFNSGGKVTLDFAGSFDQAFRVLVQPDGKIVAAGSSVAGAGSAADTDFAAARFKADGTPDNSFGTGGKVRVNAVGRIDVAQGLALQADGKLVLAGRGAPDGGSDPAFVVLRLGTDGMPDGAFGTLTSSFGLGGSVEATDVALQPDGSILACGRAQVAGIYRFALARLTAAGKLDGSFGGSGLATGAFAGLGDFGKALVLQADGKILVAGQFSGFGSNPDFGVVRFDTAGALDTGFGTGGFVNVDFFGAIDGAVGVGLQDDGKIVLGGAAKNGRQVVFALARLAQ